MEYTPYMTDDARGWLRANVWQDSSVTDALTPTEVWEAIHNNYPGGCIGWQRNRH